ncbi:hypothetical protein Pfo_006538 [Paulownia fortunei]|nr:hypothetical protein Pfo_006538 [Paulownia fortunei]
MEESDFHSFQSQKTSSITDSSSNWDFLGPDLTELILSYLPITSIVRAASVCKLWNSVVRSCSFKTRVSDSRRLPWFFLCGQNKSFSNNNYQVFAFDPESDYWIKLPDTTLLSKDSFTVSSGFFFTTCSGIFSFKPVLNGTWRQTSPFRFSRCNPLIGVYNEPDCSKPARFIVVGGIRFVDALEDVEGCLAVDIYNPHHDSWDLCPPLPEIFRPGNSSQLLCSVLFKGKFYVLGIYSSFISSFDLKKRFWSNVQTLRPPGVLYSYLISCQDRLVLAGLCSVNDELEFNLWRIDERTLEFSEIGIMPPDLLSSFLDSEGDQKFGSLKCVGSGNLVYVFNEERRWNRPACVCEISNSGKCSWRRVPSLPEPVNKFDKGLRGFLFPPKKMDRYQKVEKPKPESPVNENEIRITSQGLVRNYINYATTLLQERRVKEIVLKAMGQAISKTVAIAEIVKRRIPRLHQDTSISSVRITDTFEPIEEGLQTVEQTRHVSMISITLSTKELNKNSPGYQAPSHVNQTKQHYNYQSQQQQPPRQALAVYNSGNGDTYGIGRGHVRGRGRVWNRGGYANYQENGGYSSWGRSGGRGDWGYRGVGYGRSRGGGGRGYGRGRGRMGSRPRGESRIGSLYGKKYLSGAQSQLSRSKGRLRRLNE